MTREEALKHLDTILTLGEQVDALEMAIEALKEMPVEEYRQRLMEVFHNSDHDELLAYVVMPKEEEFKSLEYTLQQYKYEPRLHGEWVEKTGMRPPEDEGVKFCSNCMSRQPRGYLMHNPIETDFCPICGSDNRKREG